MILIFSTQIDDITNKVCEWLTQWKINFLRLNAESSGSVAVSNIELSKGKIDINFNIEQKTISFHDINIIWYRTGFFLKEEGRKFQHIFNNIDISTYLNKEINVLNDFYLLALRKKFIIGNYFTARVNKLQVLQIALSCDLLIPETIATTSKEALTFFVKNHLAIIVKPLSVVEKFILNEVEHDTYTKTLRLADVDLLEDSFFPTLFQKKIKSLFELRVFFVEESFYAMAIFSTTNLQNANIADWRWRANERSRYVPFKLPSIIKEKLMQVSKFINLDTGSFDMIVDENQNYYFLEVNPMGQFDFLNEYCNYYIDKALAEKLSSAYATK